MYYLPVSPESIKLAAEILCSGGLAAFPTETVYGLGADVYNAAAIAKIFEVKSRPYFDPLIIHIASIDTLEKTADLSALNSEAKRRLFLLTENFWPGPLSIVLPKNKNIPGIATAGLPTAAIRFPSHETARALITLSGGAIAAPSANPFGCISPTKAEHVRDSLGDKVDIILDGGSAKIGLESTVLDITNERIRILRPGGVTKEAIDEITGSVSYLYDDRKDSSVTKAVSGNISPGQLKSHYAPRTPLSALSTPNIIRQPYEPDTAWLFFNGFSRDTWLVSCGFQRNNAVRVLSESGNLIEAAACLFETLHELDEGKFSRIYCEFAPDYGLGTAINDRLRRASGIE